MKTLRCSVCACYSCRPSTETILGSEKFVVVLERGTTCACAELSLVMNDVKSRSLIGWLMLPNRSIHPALSILSATGRQPGGLSSSFESRNLGDQLARTAGPAPLGGARVPFRDCPNAGGPEKASPFSPFLAEISLACCAPLSCRVAGGTVVVAGPALQFPILLVALLHRKQASDSMCLCTFPMLIFLGLRSGICSDPCCHGGWPRSVGLHEVSVWVSCAWRPHTAGLSMLPWYMLDAWFVYGRFRS